jgi:broad specificity phosphatase PhoE
VHWFEDGDAFAAAVRRAFADLDAPAVPAWEPLAQTRDRLVPAVRRVLEQHPTDELVLCGHGTAWTLLVAELTGATPDLEEWATLAMPDVWVVPRP